MSVRADESQRATERGQAGARFRSWRPRRFWPAMLRLVAVAMLGMCFGQSTGATAFLIAERCVDTCADDGPDGRCAPLCSDCACCAHPAPSLVGTIGARLAPPPFRHAVPERPQRGLVPPGPRDIFHVPERIG